MNRGGGEKLFILMAVHDGCGFTGEKPPLMWLELEGNALFARVRWAGGGHGCKAAPPPIHPAPARTLALCFAEMDDAVTVFKSGLVKPPSPWAQLKAAAGGFDCPADIKRRIQGGEEKKDEREHIKALRRTLLDPLSPPSPISCFLRIVCPVAWRLEGAFPMRTKIHKIHTFELFQCLSLCRIIPPIRHLAKTSMPSIILPPLTGLT